MGKLQQMAYVISEQAAVAYQMMDQLGRQPEEGHGGNPTGPKAHLEYFKFAKFRKANPPSFRGASDPDKAEKWIKSMEKVFSVLAYTEY